MVAQAVLTVQLKQQKSEKLGRVTEKRNSGRAIRAMDGCVKGLIRPREINGACESALIRSWYYGYRPEECVSKIKDGRIAREVPHQSVRLRHVSYSANRGLSNEPPHEPVASAVRPTPRKQANNEKRTRKSEFILQVGHTGSSCLRVVLEGAQTDEIDTLQPSERALPSQIKHRAPWALRSCDFVDHRA